MRLQDVDLDHCQQHVVQGKSSTDRSVLFPSSFRGELELRLRIRPAAQLRLPVNEELVPNEVNLPLKLIEGLTEEFDPAKYHDTYSEEVKS